MSTAEHREHSGPTARHDQPPAPDAAQDFADADRGFLARLDPCVIKDADGRVVWDNDAYAFLAEDCPPSGPSLSPTSPRARPAGYIIDLDARGGLRRGTEWHT
ncbi:hypothetical protein AB0C95_23740 [Streptomyces caniferus]|uniref:hypothetical protein n=1 Tax=Streptomyces caniferus TaxID=285557 RepID=UPI0033D06681